MYFWIPIVLPVNNCRHIVLGHLLSVLYLVWCLDIVLISSFPINCWIICCYLAYALLKKYCRCQSFFLTVLIFQFLLQVPVPALKEQIAVVTGVLSEQQRLICRGKVLKDDQLLSAYRILFPYVISFLVSYSNSIGVAYSRVQSSSYYCMFYCGFLFVQ